MAVKRFITMLGVGVLAGSLMPAPAHATAGYLCLIGTAVRTGETYTISSSGCTGTGRTNVPVHIWSGPSAGNYLCAHAILYPLEAEFHASQCVRT